MRQRTLGFFLVPKEAEDRENDVDEGEEADEEVAVELSDDDESDSDGDDGESSDERGIETAAVLPLAPLEGNAAFQHHHHQQQQQQQQHAIVTWSIPHHLKSRQIGSSRLRAKRPIVQSVAAPSAPRQRSSLACSSFSTPARHRAAAASAAARSLRPANASLPLVVDTVVDRRDAAFPAEVAATATTPSTTATTTTSSSSLVRHRRRDWGVSDLRFDDRTGELLAVALCGPGESSAAGSSAHQQGELQLFSDASLRSCLSVCPFPTFRRQRRRRGTEEDLEDDGEEESEEDDEDGEPRERTGELTPLATVRFPDGPLLQLAWDCRSSSGGKGAGGSSSSSSSCCCSDVVAALVGGSRLSSGISFSSSSSGSRKYPSGALALFDLDDEAIFASSGSSESANRRYATAVIEPSSSSFSSSYSSSSSLALRSSAAVSLATAAPAWTTLCPCTVRSAFAVGDAAGKVHLWDRRASLKRAVGMLSSGIASSSSSPGSAAASAAAAMEGRGGPLFGNATSSSSSSSSPSLRSLALLADGQTLVGGCSDGTLLLWDVRACLGDGGSGGAGGGRGGERKGGGGAIGIGIGSGSGFGRAGVVSLGSGGGGGSGAFASSRSHSLPSASASHVGGALPAARGCLRSAVRAVPGVNALLAGTPERDFGDAVALGGVARLCAHPTDAARLGFRLDCGWNGAYVVAGRDERGDHGGSGEEAGGGDGVGAVSHLHAPPVVGRAAASSADAPAATRLLLHLRGGAWGSASSPSSFVVANGPSGSSPSAHSGAGAAAATLAVVDCLNAGSAAAARNSGNGNEGTRDENSGHAAPPLPSAVLVPIPADKAATAVAVHRDSGEVVVGTDDGCLAFFDGCL